jgi:hypothetical protein
MGKCFPKLENTFHFVRIFIEKKPINSHIIDGIKIA